MFGSDPENGGTTGADANGSAKTTQKVTLPNNAVDETSLKNRRKVRRCISNKDCEKESKLLEEVKSILRDSSRADREKLCGEVDEEGNTVLHYAAKAGKLELCKALHENGADIKARGQNDLKPLYFAARWRGG